VVCRIRHNPAPGIISGFVEWKKDGPRKRPFKIHLRDEAIMSVAGIWYAWRPGTPDERLSFSILTTAANTFMSTIHDRMPVILGRSDEDAWLDPGVYEQEALQQLLRPCPSSWLTSVEVSPLVNSAKNNTAAVLEPVVTTALLSSCHSLRQFRSVLSLIFASATVCHCMFDGASAPPDSSGTM